MSECEACGRPINTSGYLEPAEIRERKAYKFAHVECASNDELTQLLMARVQKEIQFYTELSQLIKNLTLTGIHRFEEKYGSYAELVRGAHADHHIIVSAILAELKTRLSTIFRG